MGYKKKVATTGPSRQKPPSNLIIANDERNASKKCRFCNDVEVTIMHIEVNRDLDKFKESVVLGLSARQLIYSIIALALGSD